MTAIRSAYVDPEDPRTLLRTLQLSAGLADPAADPLRHDPARAAAPLSFAQERLWLLEQIHPGLPVYNTPVSLRFADTVDVPVFVRVIAEILRRHEVLRSAIAVHDGVPRQIVRPVAADVSVSDLRGLPRPAREPAAYAVAAAEAVRLFDFSTGPLLRARLVAIDDRDWLVLLTLHHLASDRWSTDLLMREVAALYGAFSAGRPSPLSDLSVQYADYAVWQRQHLDDAAMSALVEYWREAIGDPEQVTALPIDRPRPAARTFAGASVAWTCGDETAKRLRQLARARHVTLFMLITAAFQTLLHRYSGEPSIRIATPIAGRDRVELEPVIGMFVNTLVLRTAFDGVPTFNALLDRVRANVLGAFAHREAPFERIVDALLPARDLSSTPLFQSMIVFDEADRHRQERTPARVRGVSIAQTTTPFDLMLVGEDGREGLAGTFDYSTELFDAATMRRLAGHWLTLLDGIARAPDMPVSELPFLTPDERQQAIAGWNDTGRVYPAGICMHQQFAARAAAAPDAIAIVCEDRQITYGALERRANQWARALRRRGVTRGDRVGLCFTRSIDLVAGLLAVLKAGAAYVPLDEQYPPRRLAAMLDRADAGLVLTHDGAAGLLDGWWTRDTLNVDRLERSAAEGGAMEAAAPSPGLSSDAATSSAPADAAYVLFTSGSTGEPKGVVVQHQSLWNTLCWLEATLPLTASDRVLAITTLAFDIAAVEIHLPLMAGASLHLVGRDVARDGERLARVLTESGCTLAQGTPTTWQMIADGGWESPAPITLITCGEALPPALARRLTIGARRLWNLYGPTEAAIFATGWRVGSDPGASIGLPIANTQAYVLDAHLGLLPAGIAGELYLGGINIALGYANAPAATADRFVPDPFGPPGARLYRTGDLARRRAGGEIDYLGRRDHQVKIRGYRIELQEVQSRLDRHPRVIHSLVVTQSLAAGGDAIVAYLVTDGPVSTAGLRELLRRDLPEYMVPAAFVTLPEMPRLPSGKVDRRALPPVSDHGDRATPHLDDESTPRTPAEQIVGGVLADLLHRPVGVHENFFSAGAHSLTVVQLMARLRRAFAVDLPLRAAFDAPTIAELSQRIALAAGDGSLACSPIPRAERVPHVPLSFAQQRLWSLHQFDPGSDAYHVPTALRLRGALDAGVLREAFGLVVARHDILRTTFRAVDGVPEQVVHADAACEWQTHDLIDGDGKSADLERREAEALTLMRRHAARPFDLTRAPLVRVLLLRVAADDHFLLIVLPHVITDGWSIRRLIRELTTAYHARRQGQEPRLPALPIQYADYAVWQRHHLQGSRLERQLDYWRGQLPASDERLRLPVDHPEHASSSAVATIAWRCEPAVADALRRTSRASGATMFMTVLAAFHLLLHRYSGQTAIRAGTPIAGRERWETELLIGMFVNTLVMRADVDGRQPFHALLDRVRETALGAYAHQDVPFDRVVDALKPERSADEAPLYRVMFSLDTHGAALMPAGDAATELQATPVSLGVRHAKADLALQADDTPDGLSGVIEYRAGLFDQPAMARLASHWQMLLAGIAEQPDRPVFELPWLSAAERAQLTRTWNDTSGDWVVEDGIDARFAAQARRRPDAIALSMAGVHISYGALAGRASRCSAALRAHGVTIETHVAVLMERSPDLVVAILGILGAGGVYVPLDPQWPDARVSLLVRDSGAAFVMTSSTRIAAAGGSADARRPAPGDRIRPAHPDQLACVMFTSGSTGRPKGVEVTHRGIVRFAFKAGYARLTGDECLLQLAPITFDASTLEIWTALLNGGRLAFCPERVPDPDSLRACLEAERVTTLFLTTSLFNTIVDLQPAALRSVERLLVGGEALSVPHLRIAQAHLPDLEVVNLYGPTENAVLAAGHPIPSPLPPDVLRAPIGTPIAKTQTYVLDRYLTPLPIGVEGDLFIGGEGLARGYRGRPRDTAEHFVPDAVGATPGARLYRSGDRARWLPEGVLDFLGRADAQIKIRGHRIEPGEVERVLVGCEGVRQCAVLPYGEPGSIRLIAYVVGPGERDIAALRQSLAEILPAYMMPSAIVPLATLPLASSGKLDRRLLPEPPRTEIESTSWIEPEGDHERTLAAIWAATLRLARVGAEDNFFDIGGDSIIGIQIVARALRAGLRLTPRQLFDHPTVRALARVAQPIDAPAPAADVSDDVGRDATAGWMPLHPIQDWFFAQAFAEAHWWNQSIWLDIRDGVDGVAFTQAVAAVRQHHRALRLRFARMDDRWMQRVAEDATPAITIVDLSGIAGAAAADAILACATGVQASLDLEQGPIVRAVVFRLGAAGERVLVVAHHLAVDIVSWNILLEDLEQAYERARARRPIELPRATTPYLSWCARLVDDAAQPGRAEEVAQWEAALAGGGEWLPVDWPDGSRREADAVDLARRLGVDETTTLIEHAAAAYHQRVEEVVLTALGRALGAWSGRDAVLVDVEGHGRQELWPDVDLTRTVGWCTSIQPLRVSAADDLAVVLKHVKEQMRGRADRGLGYGSLRHAGPPEWRERLARLPRGLVSFNHVGRTVARRDGLHPAEERAGANRSPRAARPYELDVSSGIDEGALWISCTYSRARFASSSIDRLFDALWRALDDIAAHVGQHGGYTPVDFPMAGLTQSMLDDIVDSLDVEREA